MTTTAKTGFVGRLRERLGVVRAALDGRVDKVYQLQRGRIRDLEAQLAEARADRDMFAKARQEEKSRSLGFFALYKREQEAHRNTHARLVRAARRVVRLRDERDSLREEVEATEARWTAPYKPPQSSAT